MKSTSNIIVDEKGQLIFARTLTDPVYSERITGNITGLIEFEGEPEFCNDRNIYFWRDEED